VKLSSLEIYGVRNLHHVKLPHLAEVNLFYGDNGAGKSSVLEAIHMLALARSFRSAQLKPVIEYEREAATVFAKLSGGDGQQIALGIQRHRRGGFTIKRDGEIRKSVVELAELLPIQLINASSYQLLDAGPKQRRQFLDWGVFHVKHSFYSTWKKAQRCIRQRNALLRQKGGNSQISLWNQELIPAANLLDLARREYFEAFQPVFENILAEVSNIDGIKASYHRGWRDDEDLGEILRNDIERDLRRGVTHSGPHRADLKITVHGLDAAQILSRGQLKLVVCALRLAQCQLMQEHTGKRCVLLVDDLPAEVDQEHQWRLCEQFDKLESQLFITCIEPASLIDFEWKNKKTPAMFHVKHGEVGIA